ncbi:hypothetical protein JZ751_023365 [Albula glossodonta]|uniref:Uncharacterized protein n=1 Tax=Albula glossodonta TaxID=121402 RepID=A0A8T2NQ85_9TELE|nr:hypothetical protein JZ751_023365 [Albula glossodonta]
MFLAVLFIVLSSTGSAGLVSTRTVVKCILGRACVIQCNCQLRVWLPTVAWCRSKWDGSYTTVAKSTDPVLGRVQMVVLPLDDEVSAWRARVYIRPVLERDAGEYWCGFLTTEGKKESLFIQEKFILRVHNAFTDQTFTDDVPLHPRSPSNTTKEITKTPESDKNILTIVVGISLLLPFLSIGLFVIKRKRKKNKVGNASHLDSVTVCELPVSNDPMLTDVTYAVLTLRPHRVAEEGHYSNIHPDRSLRLPEVVEYSSISF